ncbi:MAG: amidohydrolase family protein, partial [Dehalococcoidia bacterium]
REDYRMMARFGVTTPCDFSGEPEDLPSCLEEAGAGLNIVFIRGLVPFRTVSGRDADAAELEQFIRTSLAEGAIGVKCLGGHHPITPGTLQRTIQIGHRLGVYVAVHVGSTEHGSDIDGLEELLGLAEGLPVHVAHVNSYCRGQQTGDPLEECRRALAALRGAPLARSESYLSMLNGTGGACIDGMPASEVTKTCLRMGGFASTESGLGTAIRAGWASVWTTVGGETRLLAGAEGEQAWQDAGTQAGVSFPVNPPAAAVALAVAKEPDGHFTIDALSTDGGGIPRNTIVEQGLALVRFGAFSLPEFVRKASSNGATMLGLTSKGHLGVGADADITVLDLERGRAVLSLVAGEVIMVDGLPVGRGGTILTTTAGEKSLRQKLAGRTSAIRVAPAIAGA